MRLLMVFIDGLGLGSADSHINPVVVAEMPFTRGLLGGAPLTGNSVGAGVDGPGFLIRPTDACLGVKGLPQSATGQTVFLAGINAPQLAGRHINGFPTKALRTLLNQYSIFKLLVKHGFKATFANTFTKEYFETVNRGRWRHSATTTAALAGGCSFFMLEDLIQGDSIYQDITNEHLRERGYDQVPLCEPEAAAAILVNQAVAHHFTLFEYFQTDRCGHAQDWELARILLNRLDRFIGAVVTLSSARDITVLIISDHGNIEDLTTRSHTRNPVPTIVIGPDLTEFNKIDSLLDIYPAVYRFFGIDLEEDSRAEPAGEI